MFFVAKEQTKKIHPHKFTLWVAIASIIMMFAGLTSAYIVKKSQANWLTFDLPLALYYSTAVIVCSSLTMWMAEKKFKARQMLAYRSLMTVTSLLGFLFIVLQAIGFYALYRQGITMTKNVSVSFLYVLVGLHGLHVLGGVIALLVLFIRAFSSRIRTYNTVSIEVMSTYWHFVDLLWVYLLVFLIAVK